MAERNEQSDGGTMKQRARERRRKAQPVRKGKEGRIARTFGEREFIVRPEPLPRREVAPDGDEEPVVVAGCGQKAERRIDESENVNRRECDAVGNEKQCREARSSGVHGMFYAGPMRGYKLSPARREVRARPCVVFSQ